jgi:hypothetical protein
MSTEVASSTSERCFPEPVTANTPLSAVPPAKTGMKEVETPVVAADLKSIEEIKSV